MKTKLLSIAVILCLGMVFQGCEKESDEGITNNSSIKSKSVNSKSDSYPIPITIDITQPNALENAFNQVNSNEKIRVTFDSQGIAEHFIVPKDGSEGVPGPSHPGVDIDCDSSTDSTCKQRWKDAYQSNINAGLCHDMDQEGTHFTLKVIDC